MDARKPSDSEEQFFYKSRKKALGPFKERLWELPAETKGTLGRAYDRKFEFLFTQLGVPGTAAAVRRYVRAPEQYRPPPERGEPVTAAAHDDAEAGE
jgi:fructose-bisphosphate aldolase, class II